MIEEWRDIKDFNYQVSNLGRVRNSKGLIIKPHINKCGYIELHLGKEGKHFNKKVHRLVAEAFIPNPENKPEVDHIDTDKTNNIVSNLRWASKVENANNPLTILNRRNNNGKNKITQQYSLDNILIAEFKSSSEAARVLQLDRRPLSKAAQFNKVYGGYIWKYKY